MKEKQYRAIDCATGEVVYEGYKRPIETCASDSAFLALPSRTGRLGLVIASTRAHAGYHIEEISR